MSSPANSATSDDGVRGTAIARSLAFNAASATDAMSTDHAHIARSYVVEQIAGFAARMTSAQLADDARARLKASVLDALGCAFGAIGAGPLRAVRSFVGEMGGAPLCTLIGSGMTAPDRATLYNGCLVRYLDFMDNTARAGEVCHPADNLAALLAAAEYADATGDEFLVALAIAYQVQTRLLELPTMRAGVNYTTPLAFSVAAGAARLLSLDTFRTAHALALAGVGAVSLATIQAEPLSHWKGLASGEAASRALHNTFLARNGITGPLGVFDGPLGLFRLVGGALNIDWAREALDVPLRVSLKKHDAEFQSQTAVDLAIALRATHALDPHDIERVDVEVTDGAYAVLGGGEYGPKDDCWIKEQADHNLKYLVAVALLDREVRPAQFADERIGRADVQTLLHKVFVTPNRAFTARVPHEMPVRITIRTADGRCVAGTQHDYDGFHTRPMTSQQTDAKFLGLAGHVLASDRAAAILHAVHALDRLRVRDLTALLRHADDAATGAHGR